VVECGQCVGVLPFLDDRHVVMVRQYRYVFGEDHRWEMPTGGVNPANRWKRPPAANCAKRWGTTRRRCINQYLLYQQAIVQEMAHLYLGRNLSRVEAMPMKRNF